MMIVRDIFHDSPGYFPLYQRRDSHVLFKEPGRDSSPQGIGGEE